MFPSHVRSSDENDDIDIKIPYSGEKYTKIYNYLTIAM